MYSGLITVRNCINFIRIIAGKNAIRTIAGKTEISVPRMLRLRSPLKIPATEKQQIIAISGEDTIVIINRVIIAKRKISTHPLSPSL